MSLTVAKKRLHDFVCFFQYTASKTLVGDKGY